MEVVTPPYNGGFNALLVGMARSTPSVKDGVNREYGLSTYFWTSSSTGLIPGSYPSDRNTYYIRLLLNTSSYMSRRVSYNYFRYSVRCKKDNNITVDLEKI